MQRHVKRKFENALSVGVIALLLILLLFFIGSDINTMAIYEEKGEVLSPEGGTGLFLMIAITTITILFILFAFNFLIAENRLNEKEEKKLREFAAKCRARGYRKEEIIDMVGKHGWTAHQIKNYLD